MDWIILILVVVVCVAYAAVTAMNSYLHRPVSAEKAESWPEIDATIQTVSRMVCAAGRNVYTLDVGNFSYTVKDEYCTGQVGITLGLSAGDRTAKNLIDQKIKIRYDPRKPEIFFVPQQDFGGLLVDPFEEPLSSEVQQTDIYSS